MAKKESSIGAGTKLVIVESPTKAKTIRKFLGRNFVVESCMGHIRDLPQSAKDIPEKFKKENWSHLGVNVDKDFEPIYCIPANKTKVVRELKQKLEDADELYLATDEDREGESISWHLVEVLKPKVPVKRMVFHEITKTAIERSLKDTREIDYNLVRAQEARRILDRLVGYTISPLLWKKVAYGLSAGRVQSVAVKLIVVRERERIKFKKAEYWGLSADLEKAQNPFSAALISVDGQRVAIGKDFDGTTGQLSLGKDLILLDEIQTRKLETELFGNNWKVQEIVEKPVSRRPAPPFITSTLQQESNRKLGLSSRETMQLAQKLYEQGFITYMRTDSTFLSQEAIVAARNCIQGKYGKEYLPATPINYAAKKVKGAQEAHEAIRPAGQIFIDPDETGLDGLLFRLYDLIWKRTVASQMTEAKQKQLQVKIQSGSAIFNSSGMTIEFPGFLRAYVEGSDDPDAELAEREVRLPALKVGDLLQCKKLTSTEHETKPPARFTEASLVQTMEKEGIGRPSTYASIIGTIIDRGYVRKHGGALVPTFTAMVVSKLLEKYLHEYVDLGFTAGMERSLDTIAEGDLESLKYLASVYFGKKGLREQVELQSEKIDPDEARSVHLDGLPGYAFKVGRYGAYVETKRNGESVSASIPEKDAPADITAELIEKWIEQKQKGADSLGKDPGSQQNVYVLSGRYGPYVQLGESDREDAKPKRVSLPPTMDPTNVQFEDALDLLSLPKNLGLHPERNKEIKVGIGRFGPYVVCDGDFRSVPKGENFLKLTYNRALELLSQPKKGRGSSQVLKDLGVHPVSAEPIQVVNGPYGPYLKMGKKNQSLPEGLTPDQVTIEKAIELIGAVVAKGGKAAASNKKAKKATLKTKITNEKVVVEKEKGTATKSGATRITGKASKKTARSTGKKTPVKIALRKAKNSIIQSSR
jgi:DNA topoisomerase-1